MFQRNRFPVFAPEAETGAETVTEQPAAPPAGGTEGGGDDQGTEQLPDGPGSGRSKLRKQLEGASAQAKKRDTGERDKTSGKYQSRARQEQEGAEGEEATPQEGQQQPAQQQPQTQQQVAAPEGWPKEAKAEWAKVPPAVQAAVTKRETDMAAGVEQLKRGYADIDAAIQPYMPAIQQNKVTPAAAVKQLFSWMEALTRDAANIKAGKAAEAFPALARSYGIDPVALLAQMVQQPRPQQQQPGQQTQPGQPQIDPSVKAYLDSVLGNVGQHINQLSSTVQQQSMAKTQEMLGMWSKDKPFYEDVRVLMAKFLSPGPNGEPPVVPPLANGNADLDRAYDMAVYADPAVRAKVAEATAKAEQDKKTAADTAERQAQKQKLEAARKASGSIPISAPGTPAERPGQKTKKGKSVRESIEEARSQIAERA